MKHIQKFEKFLENTAPAPTKPGAPTTVPTRPQKPQKPQHPMKPIVKPSVDPAPKAVTEMDVAKRFIEELNKKGESVKKYLD